MDLYSYFLGVITLPALLLAILAIRSLFDRLHLGQTRKLRTLSPEPGASLSPLEFTPRLVGKLRHSGDEPSERQAS